MLHDVGAVAAAAESYLEHDEVRLLFREPAERDRRNDLELGRRFLAGSHHLFRCTDHPVSQALQRFVRDVGTVHLHPLIEHFNER